MAHYQFGQDVLSRLGNAPGQSVLTFKREFDVGLQGPDIFLFYKPYRSNRIFNYGKARHEEPAVRMFAPMLEKTREKAALSYFIGIICHYVLDKCCHPYVSAHSSARYDHQRMESAFDRYVMSRAGLTKPRYCYLPAGGLEYAAMASLWPGIEASIIKKCINAQRRAIPLLDRRRFLEACETVVHRRGALTPLTLPDSVPEMQRVHVLALSALYDNALEECPELIRTALAQMAGGGTLEGKPGFDMNFKGKAVDT
jgi:hypothetical protein